MRRSASAPDSDPRSGTRQRLRGLTPLRRLAVASVPEQIRRSGIARILESGVETAMIRKLPSGKYRLYSRKKDAKTGKRRNLGTFASRTAAERHERAIQYFKRH